MVITTQLIRDGLKRLHTAKQRPKVLGSESHAYGLNPPLTEAAVRTFELKYHIQLPEDYRTFLIELGNGGAGPFYGVFKLGEMDDGHEFKKWQEADGLVGVLSKPFPHTTAWNDTTDEPTETEDEQAYEEALNVFEERYWSTDRVNGAIPICHEGCAYRDWLVVTGPEAGYLWHDARTDRRGLYPITLEKATRVTFVDWYIHWLKGALALLPDESRADEDP